MTKSPEPLLSIGALSRETGIPIATLRTWERRYGFPVPERLDSGHRRYPVEQVERLRLVRCALEGGHRPVTTVAAEPRDLRKLLGGGAAVHGEPSPRTLHWLGLIRNFDGDALQQELRATWAKLGPGGFVLEATVPFMFEVGELWWNGNLAVQHEHFATEQLRDFLSSRWRPMHEACRGPIVICAALPGERHCLGLHMAAVLLTHHDLRVIFLGTDTPAEQIADTAFHGNGSAVVIGASAAADHGQLTAALGELRRLLPPRIALIVGGTPRSLEVEHVTWSSSLSELSTWAETFRAAGAPAPQWSARSERA